jgi:hypothetical protein
MTVAQWQSTTKNILNISNRSYRRCYFVCPARQNNWESIIRETIELWNTATFKKGHPWDCFASSYCEISLKTVKMTYFDSLLKFFFVGLVCLSSVGGKQTFYQLSIKWIFWDFSCLILKFVYSEKATKFCEISTLLLSTVHTEKSKVEISQNFVASSEYMNFICNFILDL